MLKRVAERGWWLRVGAATFGFAAIAVVATRPAPQVDAPAECAAVQLTEPTAVREIAVAHETVPPALPRERLVAVIDTSAGPINCTLDAGHAPYTVAAFARLARSGFYDGQVFDRTISDFAIQAGDPTNPDSSEHRVELADEVSNLTFDHPGVLAMANHDKTANGSQFFITDAALPQLNGTATIFGHCDHPELVHRIASMPTVGGDYPDFPVKLVVEVNAIR